MVCTLVLKLVYFILCLCYSLHFFDAIDSSATGSGGLTAQTCYRNFPPLFGFIFSYVIIEYLIRFPLWSIVILVHRVGVTSCVVHVGLFFHMRVGIHGGRQGHTLLCRGQFFLSDHGSSIV